MNIDDYIVHYFKKQTVDSYKKNMRDIKKNISMHTSSFSIDTFPLEIRDVIRKQNDETYMNGREFEYTENGIKILLPLKEFWHDIKYFIPKTITKLELPFSLIQNDISFLKNFPNLETLILNDYKTLTKENIEKIQKSTSIKEILVNFTYGYNEYYKNEGFALSDTPSNVLLYKDLFIKKNDKKDNENFSIFLNEMFINSYNLDTDSLEKLFSLSDGKPKNKVNIKTSNGSQYTIEFLDDHSLDISINSMDVKDVNKFYHYLTNKGYKVNSICYDVENMNYLDMDLSLYEEIAKSTNVMFDYGFSVNSSFEEFKGLVASLKWYREIINNSNLSPAEKIMFAFDIMKTFSYNESQNSKNDSRYPHRIIETGNIVCVGYASMLKQILKNMDNNIKIGSFGVSCYDSQGEFLGGHERSLAEVDDDKYDIHGIFALDATWDSVKKEFAEVKKYTALDLYRYFLVAARDYKGIFPNDTVPDIFKYDELEEGRLLNEYKSAFEGFKGMLEDSELIKNTTKEKIKKYLEAPRISLDTFNQMLYNVRIAEGYTPEQALKEVEKVDKMNKYLLQQSSNCNESISSYFDEEIKGIKKG